MSIVDIEAEITAGGLFGECLLCALAVHLQKLLRGDVLEYSTN
jgi:hypothetical protein